MGFKKLEVQDFILDNSSVTAPMWSGDNPTLTTIHTSSIQAQSNTGRFYYSVYDKDPSNFSSEIQFSIAYCDVEGSGSNFYNPLVTGSSPSRTNYGQYKNLILGNDEGFIFGNYESKNFYALSLERSRYKEKILPGIMTLTLSGSDGEITLTDDSKYSSNVIFNSAGRVYNLIKGEAGQVDNSINSLGWSGGPQATRGSYGWFLPDVGVILINPEALEAAFVDGGIGFNTVRGMNLDSENNKAFFEVLEGGSQGGGWTLNSEETISSNYLFIRARNNEFNFSENPSYVSGSTGAVLFDSFIDNPKTYITTIGLYNDNNDLLAVSRLSRPLRKDSTHEALIRIKLDF